MNSMADELHFEDWESELGEEPIACILDGLRVWFGRGVDL
jgi:hypothetical protein